MVVERNRNEEAIIFDFGTSVFSEDILNYHKRAVKVLLNSVDAIFHEIPTSRLIKSANITDPEIIRQAVDSIMDFISEKNNLIYISEKRAIDFKDLFAVILRVSIEITEVPVFIFEQIEDFVSQLLVSNKYRDAVLSKFYSHIFSYAERNIEDIIAGFENHNPIAVYKFNRTEARNKYIEWSSLYLKEKQRLSTERNKQS